MVAVLLILIEGSNPTVTHSISGFIYFGFDIRFYKNEKRSINAISNTIIEFINKYLEYTRSNGFSEYHQYNNLKVVIAFSKDISFRY